MTETPQTPDSGQVTPMSLSSAPSGMPPETSSPMPPAGTPGSDKRDILKTSPIEQAEIEHFIAKGHSAHSTVFLLSLLGILIVLMGAMYWNHFDYYKDGDEYVRFGRTILPALIENQNKRDWQTYQPRRDVRVPPTPPHWPGIIYSKLRFDSYLIAGLAFLLALIMIHIEKAKMRRNDLLIFRAMAREIEKLRMRLRQLERKKDDKDENNGTE